MHSCHHHDYRAKLNKKLVFAKYPAMFLIIRSDLTKIFPQTARKITRTEKELNNNPCLIRNQAGAIFHERYLKGRVSDTKMLLIFIYNEAIYPFVIGIHLLRWITLRTSDFVYQYFTSRNNLTLNRLYQL